MSHDPADPGAPPRGFASLGLLGASFASVTLVAALGGALTARGLGPWYEALPKPAWNPPAWVFGPVWTVLYALQAVAAWLVLRAGWRERGVRIAIALHALQLALQVAWSGTFFALHAPAAAVVVIVAIVATLALTTVAFRRVRSIAGLLVLPTLLWVLFATALNVAIATGSR